MHVGVLFSVLRTARGTGVAGLVYLGPSRDPTMRAERGERASPRQSELQAAARDVSEARVQRSCQRDGRRGCGSPECGERTDVLSCRDESGAEPTGVSYDSSCTVDAHAPHGQLAVAGVLGSRVAQTVRTDYCTVRSTHNAPASATAPNAVPVSNSILANETIYSVGYKRGKF